MNWIYFIRNRMLNKAPNLHPVNKNERREMTEYLREEVRESEEIGIHLNN